MPRLRSIYIETLRSIREQYPDRILMLCVRGPQDAVAEPVAEVARTRPVGQVEPGGLHQLEGGAVIGDVENGNMARANRVRRVGNEVDVDIPDRHAPPFCDDAPRNVAAKAGSPPGDNRCAAGESALENLHYQLFINQRG